MDDGLKVVRFDRRPEQPKPTRTAGKSAVDAKSQRNELQPLNSLKRVSRQQAQ